MQYIKRYHKLQPEEGCRLHLKEDYGSRVEDNKYKLPDLSDEIYLAINLTKDTALEMYEDIELNKLDEYKKQWKKKIKEQEELDKEKEAAQEPELEDFDEGDE